MLVLSQHPFMFAHSLMLKHVPCSCSFAARAFTSSTFG